LDIFAISSYLWCFVFNLWRFWLVTNPLSLTLMKITNENMPNKDHTKTLIKIFIVIYFSKKIKITKENIYFPKKALVSMSLLWKELVPEFSLQLETILHKKKKKLCESPCHRILTPLYRAPYHGSLTQHLCTCYSIVDL
jgi:hypothetical protein